MYLCQNRAQNICPQEYIIRDIISADKAACLLSTTAQLPSDTLPAGLMPAFRQTAASATGHKAASNIPLLSQSHCHVQGLSRKTTVL